MPRDTQPAQDEAQSGSSALETNLAHKLMGFMPAHAWIARHSYHMVQTYGVGRTIVASSLAIGAAILTILGLMGIFLHQGPLDPDRPVAVAGVFTGCQSSATPPASQNATRTVAPLTPQSGVEGYLCSDKDEDENLVHAGDRISYSLHLANNDSASMPFDQFVGISFDEGEVYVPGSSRIWVEYPHKAALPKEGDWTLDKDGYRMSRSLRDSWIYDSANVGEIGPGVTVLITFQAQVLAGVQDGKVIEAVAFISEGEIHSGEAGKNNKWQECAARTVVKAESVYNDDWAPALANQARVPLLPFE